jgi:hypothetical protein
LATTSLALGDLRQPVAVFTVRKLKHGGYEVLVEGDPDMPRRHVSDFRSESEAKIWIEEHGVALARRAGA